LYDSEHNWAFESKGYQAYSQALEKQARSQAALVDKGFLNGTTWFSLPNNEGEVGFSATVWRDTLEPLGIKSGYWIDGEGMTYYTPLKDD
jgi:hypothetical protein